MADFLQSQYFEINLIDWDKDGWISCSNTSSRVIAYKIPRNKLYCHSGENEDDENTLLISNSGIYILLGDKQTYVGQAATRETKQSFMARLAEHDKAKEFWTEAIVLTTLATSSSRSYDQSELDYLENLFIKEIRSSPKYSSGNTNKQYKDVKNINIKKSAKQTCNLDFEMEKLYVSILGYDLFENIESINDDDINRETRNDINEQEPKTEKKEKDRKPRLVPVAYIVNGVEYHLSESERVWKKVIDNIVNMLITINPETMIELAKNDFRFLGKRSAESSPLLTLNRDAIKPSRKPTLININGVDVYYNTNLDHESTEKFIRMLLAEYKNRNLLSDDNFVVMTSMV